MNSQDDYPSLSNLEMMVLNILISEGASREVYGFELIEKSNGLLKKGSIYVTLTRMEDKGYISSRKEEVREGARGLPRRMYKTEGLGLSIFSHWQNVYTGMQGVYA